MTKHQKQRQLQFLGYYSGKIDGKFGLKSKSATAKFQEDFGLIVDGDFGENTQNKTIEIVTKIQKKIGANVDGIVGNETVLKLSIWQKENGLANDGIAGAKTRSKMGIKTVDFWETIKHFKRNEFKCKCGGKYCSGFPVEINHTLVMVAERARNYFAKPITVSSGIRCSKHNANVGGVTNSRHKKGKAMDFYVNDCTSDKVLKWVKKQPEIRYAYAIDRYYVHMDVK